MLVLMDSIKSISVQFQSSVHLFGDVPIYYVIHSVSCEYP